MVKSLTEAEHAQVASRIAVAERAVDVEIRLVVARSSEDYSAVVLLMLLAAMGVGIAVALGLIMYLGVDVMLARVVAATSLATVWLFRHALMPSSVKQRAVALATRAAFGELLSQLPAGRSAILFYCSVAERRAEYVYDRTIGVVVPETVWAESLKPFAAHMQGKNFAAALSHVVDSIEVNLKPFFPRKDGAPVAGAADDLIEK